ncbi:MAG: hypothetical protein NC406_01035 [Bacteroides sp.]|nr:hypothetical protein [Bacteroides sp.]
MQRHLASLLLLLLLTAATAAGRHYRVPGAGERLAAISWHVRATADERGGGRWGIRWHEGDRGRFVEISHPGADGTDHVTGTLLTVTAGRLRGDTATVDSTLRLRIPPYTGSGWRSGVSLRLTAGEGGAAVAIGRRRAESTIDVPMHLDSLDSLESYVGGGAVDILLDTMHITATPLPRYVDADSAVALATAGGDPRCSLWTYFDRDTDPLRSRPGGRYELASTVAPDGRVLLVYLGGAADRADEWRPGRIKAEMRPTLIPGVYDLTWYAADGSAISLDAGATIEQHLLTVQFPDRRATLRFRRR